MRIGLALGGGGARGFSHLGVLEVLEEEGIPIDIVSGTSMGAVIGALYALYKDSSKAKYVAYTFNKRDIVGELEKRFSPHANASGLRKTISFLKDIYTWNLKAVKKWLIDHRPFEVLFREVFDDYAFSDCRLPFVCTAVDVLEGEEVDFDCGMLYQALLASSALPGVFPPLKKDGRVLVDGGVIAAVPTEALRRRGADFVVAVSLESRKPYRNLSSSANILMSVDEIRHKKIVERCLQQADIVIEPDLKQYSWADFSQIDAIIRRGREAAQEAVPLLKSALRRRKLFFWKSWFSPS